MFLSFPGSDVGLSSFYGGPFRLCEGVSSCAVCVASWHSLAQSGIQYPMKSAKARQVRVSVKSDPDLDMDRLRRSILNPNIPKCAL